MINLLVMCGTGIATSTIVTGKVRDWLEENGYSKNVKLKQGKLTDELSRLDDYDIVISTTLVPDNVKDQVISGVSLITGVGADKVYDKVREEIEKRL